MPQNFILLLVLFVLLWTSCDSQKSRQATEQKRHLFSMTQFKSWNAKKLVEKEISESSSSLEESSSSIMLSSSSQKRNAILVAKIDSFHLVVENASGSGLYLKGDTISVVPVDKLDSGLCFQEWDVSNSKSLETNENSNSAQVIMPEEDLKIKAVFKSCYEGLKSVMIGNLIWTTQNMNIWTFSGSWCYENKSKNCKRYGRLYDFETAQKICRSGWRLPTDQEWNAMAKVVGKEAGLKLKSRDGWVAEGEIKSNGIDAVGFAGLPAGIFYEGNFLYEGIYAYFWTATEATANTAWFRSLSYDNDEIYRHSNYKQAGYSVRCVQNL